MSRSLPVLLPMALIVWASCAHEPKPVVVPPRTEVAQAPVSRSSPPPSRDAEANGDGDRNAQPGADTQAIFFDFDSAALRPEAGPTLQEVATELKRDGRIKLRVEGNCDQLGTVEYNLALGEQRARAAEDYLQRLGVSAGRISTISYGAQRPKFPDNTEDARARNRRDDLLVTR